MPAIFFATIHNLPSIIRSIERISLNWGRRMLYVQCWLLAVLLPPSTNHHHSQPLIEKLCFSCAILIKIVQRFKVEELHGGSRNKEGDTVWWKEVMNGKKTCWFGKGSITGLLCYARLRKGGRLSNENESSCQKASSAKWFPGILQYHKLSRNGFLFVFTYISGKHFFWTNTKNSCCSIKKWIKFKLKAVYSIIWLLNKNWQLNMLYKWYIQCWMLDKKDLKLDVLFLRVIVSRIKRRK